MIETLCTAVMLGRLRSGVAMTAATDVGALLAAIVLSAVLGSCAPSVDPPPAPSGHGGTAAALVATAAEGWRATPEMEIADAYKWLFQATQGGEHAVSDETGPRRWLDAEWESLGAADPDEPLLVPLRPDGSLVRVNLRPYRAAAGSRDALLAAFVASARRFEPRRDELDAAWRLLGELLRRAPMGGITLGAWERLDAELRSAGFPAVHHSAAYERAYRPAYRVVLRDEFERALSQPTPALTTPGSPSGRR